MTGMLNILIFVALAIVFVILGFGIFALVRGGEFGRNWSNRLMRLRVLFQAIAIGLIMLAFWAAGGGGG